MSGSIGSPISNMPNDQNSRIEGGVQPQAPSQRFNVLFPNQVPEKLGKVAFDTFSRLSIAKSESRVNSTVLHVPGKEGISDRDYSVNTASLCKRMGISRLGIFLSKHFPSLFGNLDDLIKNKAAENLKKEVLEIIVKRKDLSDIPDITEILINLPPELNTSAFASEVMEKFRYRDVIEAFREAAQKGSDIKGTILEKMANPLPTDKHFSSIKQEVLEIAARETSFSNITEILINVPPALNTPAFASEVMGKFLYRDLIMVFREAAQRGSDIKGTILEKMANQLSNDMQFSITVVGGFQALIARDDRNFNQAIDYLYQLPDMKGLGKKIADSIRDSDDRKAMVKIAEQRMDAEGVKQSLVVQEFIAQFSRAEGSKSPVEEHPLAEFREPIEQVPFPEGYVHPKPLDAGDSPPPPP